ncbi:MAG: flagellar hook-length control protein FliK [Candidatus Puniceispirillaceae bacterium]
MSEIASKPNTGPSASLAQPFAKKGAGAEHDLLFAALFGGVVAAETDANPDGNSDILAAMQAVAAMTSGQRGTGRSSGSEADAALPGDAVLVDEDDLASLDREPGEDTLPANPMMIGPMPLQQQAGTSLPVTETSAVMAQMALEDEAVMPLQHKGAALSSSALQTMKSAEKAKGNSNPIDEVLTGEGDGESTQPRLARRADGQAAIKPIPDQPHFNRASLANSKTAGGFDANYIDMDGDMQFDSPDALMRAVAGQTDRVVGRMNGQTVSGESLSANAVRQMQAAGISVGGQMSQQNNGQSSGQSSSQSGGFVSASTSMTNGSMMDMLDMAQDNWTEMLLQRVERGLAGGKDKIDFHLNPRNLGKMRISLVVQNDRTNVHIQTETGAAAQMLSDAEARLAQMMEASGLKFGNLTSQHNQNFAGNFTGNFAGQNSGQGRDGGASHAAAAGTVDGTDETNAEISVEQSENLINMQA